MPNTLPKGETFYTLDLVKTMVTFASFAPPLDESYGHGGARYAPDDRDDMDMEIDFDDDDFTGNRLTCPGEPLTSSHAFMRYVGSPGSGPRSR